MDILGLTWVIVDGKPRRVTDFAGLPLPRRPRATCPQCGGLLILKLGNVRRHHAAHAPHDRCAASRPETALHIDLKNHLATELEHGLPISIQLAISAR